MRDFWKTALVVDASGNVTVTGSAWNGSSLDYHTVQYDNTGAMLWEMGYNDKYNFTDAPMDIAPTNDGGVVVTGQCLNPDTTWSYVTVKYLAHEFVMPVDSDSVSTSLRWLTNRDQLLDTDTNVVERVKFYSNQCYPNLYFMPDTLSYVFFQGVDTTNDDTLHRIDMTFNGANADQKLLPMGKESYWNNYYLGHIPEGRPFVSLHERLVKQDVWPNIDVIYSSNQRGLKYYIVVHPGGEAGAISLEYHGYDALSVDGNEALVIESSIGELVQPQALAYEMDANGELDLLGWQPEYKVTSGEVVFEELGEWDGDLVIEVNWGYKSTGTAGGDNLEWSTYFGGSDIDEGTSITTDYLGNVYVVGYTRSFNFPIYQAINPNTPNGEYNGFFARFFEHSEQNWTTTYGGTLDEFLLDLEYVAANGRLYLAGTTESEVIPLPNPNTGNYLQTDFGGGGNDGLFLEVLPSDGRVLWATYFGGDGEDVIKGLATDASGNVYFCGYTTAASSVSQTCAAPSTAGAFPLCGQGMGYFYQSTFGGGMKDGILGAISSSNNALVWSTYFGGNETDDANDIVVRGSKIIIGGFTETEDIPSSPNVVSPCAANSSGNFPLCDFGGGSWFQSINAAPGTGFFCRVFDWARVDLVKLFRWR